MKIAMLYPNAPKFLLNTHDEQGLGGSESGFTRTVQYLSRRGHEVYVFNQSPLPAPIEYAPNLHWLDISSFKPREPYDVVYSLRHREPFQSDVNAKLKVLFLADTESHGLGDDVKQGRINLVMSVSHWQKEKIQSEEGIPNDYWIVTSNGVDGKQYSDDVKRAPGRCLFTATPERGLANLLDVWPRIRQEVPDATLHLYSSFIGWGHTRSENEQMLYDLYYRISNMADQGVVNYQHAKPSELATAQLEATAYLYPSDFYETCCMSVLESMYRGTIPVVTGRAGLLEKVVPNVTGFTVPPYGGDTARYQKVFVDRAVDVLTMDPIARHRMSMNCRSFAEQFTYDVLVGGWEREWQERL